MKIKQVQICNFRSIKNLDFDFKDFTVLLGANNSGKSNILKALNFFFQNSERITLDDVFAFFEGDETLVSVVVTFDSLSDREEEVYKKYYLKDGTIRIRKSCKVSRDSSHNLVCSSPSYNGWIEKPDRWFLRDNAFDRLSSKEKRESEAGVFKELAPLLQKNVRFTKETLHGFQERYIADHESEILFDGEFEDGPLFGRATLPAGILPEIILIPAIRDLSDEMKITSKTLLGKLVSNVLDGMAENNSEYQSIIKDVEDAIARLNDKQAPNSAIGKLESELSEELASWGVRTTINVEPPSIAKIFELGTSLIVDDGVTTGAGSKGDGLQRAIIFSLVKVIANQSKKNDVQSVNRNNSESQIYAIEEAELYLHPHKQREFYSNLKKISEDDNTQVIITTHSSHFVRMQDYKNLVLIRKQSKEIGTVKCQCCKDIFDPEDKEYYKLVHYINPDNSEIFFARKVILVEGESEKVIFPYLAERLGLFKSDVSIIDCGSKFNLPLYVDLLNHFEIPYCVIFDEDPMKPSYDNPGKERADRTTYEFNKIIEESVHPKLGELRMISPDFEGCFGISRSQWEKLGKGLAALKHFQMINDEAIPEVMIQLLTRIYA